MGSGGQREAESFGKKEVSRRSRPGNVFLLLLLFLEAKMAWSVGLNPKKQ